MYCCTIECVVSTLRDLVPDLRARHRLAIQKQLDRTKPSVEWHLEECQVPMLVVRYIFLRQATDANMNRRRFSSDCQHRDDVPCSLTC